MARGGEWRFACEIGGAGTAAPMSALAREPAANWQHASGACAALLAALAHGVGSRWGAGSTARKGMSLSPGATGFTRTAGTAGLGDGRGPGFAGGSLRNAQKPGLRTARVGLAGRRPSHPLNGYAEPFRRCFDPYSYLFINDTKMAISMMTAKATSWIMLTKRANSLSCLDTVGDKIISDGISLTASHAISASELFTTSHWIRKAGSAPS